MLFGNFQIINIYVLCLQFDRFLLLTLLDTCCSGNIYNATEYSHLNIVDVLKIHIVLFISYCYKLILLVN